jgi:hypothetical protein
MFSENDKAIRPPSMNYDAEGEDNLIRGVGRCSLTRANKYAELDFI